MELNAYFVKIDILFLTCSKHIFKGFCQILGLLYNPFLCYYELPPPPTPLRNPRFKTKITAKKLDWIAAHRGHLNYIKIHIGARAAFVACCYQ